MSRMEPDVDHPEPIDAVTALIKRSAVIDCIRERPRRKRDIQDELGVSRSTVYKAIRELEELRLVEQTSAGCQLSLLGRLLSDEYEEFFRHVETICRPGTLLDHLPADADLTTDVLVGADVVVAQRHAPRRPVTIAGDLIRDATEVRGFSPVALPQYVDVFRDEIVSGTLAADLLLEEPVVEYLIDHYREELAESFESDDLAVWRTTESLPFGLILVDAPERAVIVMVYDDGGELRGLISNRSERAFAWGTDLYERHLTAATAVDPPL